MNRYFRLNFIVVAVLALLISISGACQDRLVQCPTQKSNCNTLLIVREYCPLTCGLCSSNPCVATNGGCDQICTWTGDVAICSCEAGFRLGTDNRTCEDINECEESTNSCFLGLPAYCVNTVGSSTCQAYSCDEPGTMNYYRSGQCCQLTNSTCGITPTIQQSLDEVSLILTSERVYGGMRAAASAWPWMAEILFRGAAHCGATLISNRWMLSAAHCFSENSYRYMVVYLGTIRSSRLTSVDTSRRIQRRISEVIIHEQFDVYESDIALIRLDEPVPLDTEIIQPICLPCGETPEEKTKCWATGFGRTESTGFNPSDVLLEVDLPIVSTDMCAQSYKDYQHIDSETMMCAGYPEGQKDACTGDSGGPLACQRKDSCEWYLAGITSFGKGCAQAGFYGVYVNVVNFEPWIRENMGDDAGGLCRKIYNPCRGLSNTGRNCYKKLHMCATYSHFAEINCSLACCQLKNGEIPDCEDKPEVANVCKTYVKECNNPVLRSFMWRNCRKTCRYC
ncbi:coagulation factor VII-like [Clavelina lepadiformis]|uniref:coagulation factor VII-like n=1 Tax=Clavelina lepadiformis TaxID=159417 RepID=UPI0040418CBE